MALVTKTGFLRSRVKPLSFHNDCVRACRGFFGGCSSSPGGLRAERLIKRLLGLVSGAVATCGSIIYLIDRSLLASGLEAKPPSYPWSMNGILSSLDHSSIRRGWQVYRSVCSTCHSIRFLRFDQLVNVSHTESEMKAIAAQYQIDDGPDDDGNYFKRPGKLQDRVPEPFPNEEASRAANNGAYPVDLSLIINARRAGKDYLFSLLTGYCEAPAGFELAEGQLFNPYFPGGAISMPEMVQDGAVDYEDGTPATRSQIAKDVVEFLTFVANQDWEMRKVSEMKSVGICGILLALLTHMNRSRWVTVKSRKIFHVPKTK
ncbi:cytochrome c1-2, heme protein, mitochondrial-like [Venturia canescens]|uniref:cytochrome c1-2, heme protein, mitochondrial-like n=1 Tax=Venturia canescens TaxID=32260 RepID=UPI001C9D0D78|nr:cytochrome c1-2, heme protein, mitochondrial-like [Venturia canescens]